MPAKYPRFALSEQHEAKVIDIVHETGRDAPLARVRFENVPTLFSIGHRHQNWLKISIWIKVTNFPR